MSLALWLCCIAARGFALPRLIVWRFSLAFFSAFIILATTQSFVLFWAVKWGGGIGEYARLQEWFFPWAATLHVLACMEAAWWLSVSLPRFRRIGAVLMLASVLLSFLASNRGWRDLAALEQSFGLGLGVFLGITLMIHSFVGTEARSAMWHAGALAMLSGATALQWFIQVPALMFGFEVVKLAAAILWLRNVQHPPTWIAPEPSVTADELESARRAFKRAVGRLEE